MIESQRLPCLDDHCTGQHIYLKGAACVVESSQCSKYKGEYCRSKVGQVPVVAFGVGTAIWGLITGLSHCRACLRSNMISKVAQCPAVRPPLDHNAARTATVEVISDPEKAVTFVASAENGAAYYSSWRWE